MPRIRSIVFPLFVALLTGTAQAATYWVSPTGTGGKSGADSLTNATTLAWFNANAVGGDVCRFKSGTYSDPVQPAHDGTSGSRIRYYGFANAPSAVTVADIQFGYQHGSYSTARWFNLPGGMTGCDQAAGMSTVGDSVVRVIAGGGIGIHGKQAVFDSLTLTGTISGTGQSHFIDLSGTRDHYNDPVIGEWTNGALNNRFTNSTINLTVATTASQGDVHGMLLAAAGYNQIIGNTFNITVNSCFGYFFAVEQYEGYSNLFQGNTWNITLNASPGGSHGVWTHRDSSSYNRYIGNTVNIVGTGDLSFMSSNPGSFPGTTGHNMYSNNIIRDDIPQSGFGVFGYYNGCRYDTLQFNVIRTKSTVPVVLLPGGSDIAGMVVRHNTFYTAGPTAVDFGSANAATAGTRLNSNIYYCGAANASNSENLKVSAGCALDSAGVFFSTGSSAANRAIRYNGTDGAPGSGGSFGNSSESVWGSPRFVDSTATNFNPMLTSSSYATGANFRDGFAGALPFGGSGDVTPPSSVSNLALSQSGGSSLSASWTAPGNDGNVGTASVYDLRWSTALITAANFLSATAVSPQPVPASSGTPQSYLATGLSPGTTYYFALRTADAAGNWSALSNVPSLATLAGDTQPPAAIGDLRGQ